jgi:hypothetical protein
VRGYDHRYRGVPRQDEFAVCAHPDGRSVAFAVADGVSTAPLGHRGAEVACATAVRALCGRPVGPPPWPAVLAEVAAALTVEAARWIGGNGSEHPADPSDPAAAARLLGTTLVAGVAYRTDPARPGGGVARASLAQVGDSAAWLLRPGRYDPLLTGKGAAGTTPLAGAVAPLPWLPAEPRTADLTMPGDAVLLIGTDGFGDPLGDGDGLVGALFSDALYPGALCPGVPVPDPPAPDPPALDPLCPDPLCPGAPARPPSPVGLARLLDFSRETFDDDRALVAVWPGGAR